MQADPSRRTRRGRKRPSGRRREPLQLWRTASLRGIHLGEIERLDRVLDHVELLGVPRWRASRRFDAAEAAGVALRHLRMHGATGSGTDVAMSAVLLHAVNGCAASRTIVDHARRLLVRERRRGVPKATR